MAFGTRGHRGSSLNTAFNEDHIAATTQAIVEYRAEQGITGPLFIGARHARAERARPTTTALEVLVANGVRVLVDEFDDYVPTPALVARDPRLQPRPGTDDEADGIVVTPSHNPPTRRRLQVQPAARRPGRHRRDRLDRRTAPTSSSPTACAT